MAIKFDGPWLKPSTSTSSQQFLVYRRCFILPAQSCLNLPAVQSVEFSELEVEVSQFQENQVSEESISVSSEKCDAVTTRLEELESQIDDEGVSTLELLASEARGENAHSVQDHHQCVAGCCKLNEVCSDATMSQDPRDDRAELDRESKWSS